jgi:hypothetical protein
MKVRRFSLYAIFFAATIIAELTHEGAPGGFWFCNQPNWNGQCKWIPPSKECTTLAFSSLDERPNSIGPDWGGYCILYDKQGCTGDIVEVVPGNRLVSRACASYLITCV